MAMCCAGTFEHRVPGCAPSGARASSRERRARRERLIREAPGLALSTDQWGHVNRCSPMFSGCPSAAPRHDAQGDERLERAGLEDATDRDHRRGRRPREDGPRLDQRLRRHVGCGEGSPTPLWRVHGLRPPLDSQPCVRSVATTSWVVAAPWLRPPRLAAPGHPLDWPPHGLWPPGGLLPFDAERPSHALCPPLALRPPHWHRPPMDCGPLMGCLQQCVATTPWVEAIPMGCGHPMGEPMGCGESTYCSDPHGLRPRRALRLRRRLQPSLGSPQESRTATTARAAGGRAGLWRAAGGA